MRSHHVRLLVIAVTALAAAAVSPRGALAAPPDVIAASLDGAAWLALTETDVQRGFAGLHLEYPLLAGAHLEPRGASRTRALGTASTLFYQHRSTGALMALVPGGTFKMGSPPEEAGRSLDEAEHTVTVAPFLMSVTEVSFAQALAMGSCAWISADQGAAMNDGQRLSPSGGMTWREAVDWCAARAVRLPTEAEWEWAARAGTKGPFWAPNDMVGLAAGDTPEPELIFPNDVGRRNPFGLVAMNGNVAEWVSDWYAPYNTRLDKNPTGPAKGEMKVVRGGAAGDTLERKRSAARGSALPDSRDAKRGFRFVIPLAKMVCRPLEKPVKLPAGADEKTKVTAEEFLLWRQYSVTEVAAAVEHLKLHYSALLTLTPQPNPRDHGAGAIGVGLGAVPDYVHPATSIRLRFVPGGSFLMGSPVTEKQRNPDETLHMVTIPPFLIGVLEVSEKEWTAGGGRARESGFVTTPASPVVRVSHVEASTWMKPLGFSFPTEAQWEFASRAGVWSAFGQLSGGGSSAMPGNVNLGRPVWPTSTPLLPGGGVTDATSGTAVSGLGLMNIFGNAAEWCADWYGDYGSAPVNNPAGASSGTLRVVRGGSWAMGAEAARCAARFAADPRKRSNEIGFRVVVNLGMQAKSSGKPMAFEPRIDPTRPDPAAQPAAEQGPTAVNKSGKIDGRIELFLQTPSDPAEVRGDKLVRDGLPSQAVKEYLAVTRGSETPLIQLKLARVYESMNDSEKRKNALNRARQIAPADPVVLHEAARFHSETGDWDSAFPLMRDAMKAPAPPPPTVMLAAIVFARTKKFDEAFLHAGKVIRGEVAPLENIEPKLLNRVTFAYGLAVRGNGKPGEAVEHLVKGAEPDSLESHSLILDTMMEAKRFLDAWKHADAAWQRISKSAPYFQQRQMEAWLKIIPTPDAAKLRDTYRQTIVLDPDHTIRFTRPPFKFFMENEHVFRWPETTVHAKSILSTNRDVYVHDQFYSSGGGGVLGSRIKGSDQEGFLRAVDSRMISQDSTWERRFGPAWPNWAKGGFALELSNKDEYRIYYTTAWEDRTILLLAVVRIAGRDDDWVKLVKDVVHDAFGSITWDKK